MNIKKAIALTALLAATTGISPVALAQDAGFYAGASIGRTDVNVDTGPVFAAGATTFSHDNSDTGWKIYGGYQFHRNWGAELGYVDLGSIGFRGTVGAVPFAGNVDVTAWTLALVGTLPVHQNFDIFGKAGLYNWKSKGSATVAGIAAVTSSDDGTDALFGVGVRYNFTKNFGVQLEAEHFAGEDKVNLFSIGLRFKF